MENAFSPNFPQIILKFPKFSTFSRWVATLKERKCRINWDSAAGIPVTTFR